jgi:CRP/FNR family transcriptional regulator, nitrogen oxide reductase regulator
MDSSNCSTTVVCNRGNLKKLEMDNASRPPLLSVEWNRRGETGTLASSAKRAYPPMLFKDAPEGRDILMEGKTPLGIFAPNRPKTTVRPITGIVADLKPRFLEGLAPSDLKVILAAARQRQFCAHSVITHYGDNANHFFLLSKGRGRFFYVTELGRKILLHWFAPGQIFGVMSLLLNPSCYLVSTEMVKEGSVLVWDRATIQSLVTRYPRLAVNALSTASEYLALALAAHISMTCHNARERLAEILISLARGVGQHVPGGVELDVTNEELANAANITPFTTSRLLSEWRRTGALVKHRGKLILLSPEQLFHGRDRRETTSTSQIIALRSR